MLCVLYNLEKTMNVFKRAVGIKLKPSVSSFMVHSLKLLRVKLNKYTSTLRIQTRR